jgi:hypothetical protein
MDGSRGHMRGILIARFILPTTSALLSVRVLHLQVRSIESCSDLGRFHSRKRHLVVFTPSVSNQATAINSASMDELLIGWPVTKFSICYFYVGSDIHRLAVGLFSPSIFLSYTNSNIKCRSILSSMAREI